MATKKIPLEEKRVDSWEEFEKELKNLSQPLKPNGEPGASLLFRGQPDSTLLLETSLERSGKKGMLFKEYYRLISTMKPEIETFTGTQWSIPEYREVENLTKNYDPVTENCDPVWNLTYGRLPGYDYMAYLRHHGFPSPLLDWTRSPYIAAWFAFREFREVPEVSIYALSEGQFKRGGTGEPSIHRCGPYVKTHQRHFLQPSEYTVCLVYNDADEWRFAKHEDVSPYSNPDRNETYDFTFKKFIIPSGERMKVLSSFDKYNLNAFSLLGSEESLLETMALRKLRFSE